MSTTVSLLVYPKEAKELLGVGTTQFYELRKLQGFPKARKPGGEGRSMYLRKELTEWANSLAKEVV